MVTACQTCGNIGFPNALLICEKCRIATQHRYCSKILTYTEDVTWFCVDCEPTSASQDKPTRVPSRRSDRIKKLRIQAFKSRKRLMRKSKGNTRLVTQKEQQKCDSPSLQQGDMNTMVEHSDPVQTTADIVDLLFCEEDNDEPCENQAEAQEDSKPQRMMQENQEAICTTNKVSESGTDGRHDTLDNCFHIPAQPIIYPVWTGQVDICNKTASNKSFGLVEGFAAHLSNKACLKVSKEAILLPALLLLDMLPRSGVWPKSFEISQPSDDNIALYFFPGNKIDEKVYDDLVDDMVNKELAMKAVVENAELLVFASTELPLRYWNFQGKHYLWGVFRSKQSSCHRPLEPPGI